MMNCSTCWNWRPTENGMGNCLANGDTTTASDTCLEWEPKDKDDDRAPNCVVCGNPMRVFEMCYYTTLYCHSPCAPEFGNCEEFNKGNISVEFSGPGAAIYMGDSKAYDWDAYEWLEPDEMARLGAWLIRKSQEAREVIATKEKDCGNEPAKD